MTELEVAGVLEKALRDEGSEGFPFATIVASGPRSALPHARVADREIDARRLPAARLRRRASTAIARTSRARSWSAERVGRAARGLRRRARGERERGAPAFAPE